MCMWKLKFEQQRSNAGEQWQHCPSHIFPHKLLSTWSIYSLWLNALAINWMQINNVKYHLVHIVKPMMNLNKQTQFSQEHGQQLQLDPPETYKGLTFITV